MHDTHIQNPNKNVHLCICRCKEYHTGHNAYNSQEYKGINGQQNVTECNILPLDAILGLLLNESNTFKYVSNIIYSSFLPYSELICSLNTTQHNKVGDN